MKKVSEQVKKEAAFLLKWSKGKPIRFWHSGSEFWACGKYMTKISHKTIDAMVAAGLAKATNTALIGWNKPPSAAQIVLNMAPPMDEKGVCEIVMVKQ